MTTSSRLFTSESVTEGHPDKICDAISDSILDAILTDDPKARVAVETLVTTGQVHVAGEVTTTPASFTPRRRPQRIVSTDEVAAATGESSVLLVNALDRESFAGGHIPGSVNVPFAELVDDAGRLRPLEELRRLFDDAGALDPSVRPVTYCGGGIAATAAAFALHSLGRDDVAVYDGSMNAWTADPARPLS